MNSDLIKESFDNIVKSAEDNRNYKAFHLNNGLKVVVISDPETDKSAAALSVNIGHMSDPREIPGLAHFLEHMLFMGTKKYPEENDYDKYISRNGGSNNAFTSESDTNFHFDVSPNHLTGALDRFAQFFLEPTFTESATLRELKAVNAEHERNLDDDDWRLAQLDQSLSDPNHDFNKFGTGNILTLQDMPLKDGINVRQALLKFHNQWYSANIMSLVVLGKDSIEELVQFIIPLFSKIKNNSAVPPNWPSSPYTDNYLRKQTFIVPIRDSRSLGITFPIPDLVPHYKSQPGHYIAQLIGHEGPGSLLSELKSRGWSSSVECCDKRGAKGFGFFQLNVDLSEEGIERIDEIITLIFQYINLLKREGPKEWIYKEEKRIKEIKFQFRDKEPPISYVSDLASTLHDYPLSQCLSADQLLEEYRPDLITDVLNLLTPNKIRVAIVAKKFSEVTDSTEKWYGTRYKVVDITPERIHLWTNCGFNDKLALPPINDFIPSNLSLKTREPIADKIPQMIRNTEFSRLWYLQDNQYMKPKLYYGFKLTNPIANADPFHANANSLFSLLFNDSINEYSYSAELVGLTYSLCSSSTGLTLELSGYNDKMDVLLTKIINKLIDFKIDSKRFDVFKEIQIRSLKNYPTRPMSELLGDYTYLITCKRYWSNEELLQTAPELTVENLSKFIIQLLSRLHIEALIHGNIERSEAIKVCDLVENQFRTALKTRSIPLSQHYRNRGIQLTDGSNYSFETTSAIHQTKAIRVYFQIGVQETHLNAALALINQLIKEPVAYSSLHRANGVLGIIFVIQSSHTPSYLNERIEAFISWAENYIREMSEEDFEAEKQALIVRKLEKPKQMLSFSKKLLGEIETKEYNFYRDEIEVDVVRKLSKKDIVDIYKFHLSHDSPNRKKLSISILSANAINDVDSNKVINKDDGLFPAPKLKEPKKIENLSNFKDRQPLYPLPEPFINVYEIEMS